MIKLLLVDDESATRNGLMKHIPWNDLGIDEVREASDGYEALSIAEELEPDIVVSDIRMPGMEGTLFCAHLVNRFPGCKVIFISGYSDGEYLKAAIKIHALSYIEKPIELEALKTELRKAVEMCRKEQKDREVVQESLPYYKQRILLDLLQRDRDAGAAAAELAAAGMNVNLDAAYTALIVEFYIEGESCPEDAFMLLMLETVERIFADTFCFAAITGNGRITVVLEDGDADMWPVRLYQEITRAATESQPDAEVFIAVGEVASGLQNLSLSNNAALEAAKSAFYIGYGHIVRASDAQMPPADTGEALSICFRNLLFEDENALIRDVEALRERLRLQRNPMINDVKNFYFNLILTLFHEAERLGVNLEEMTKSRRMYLWEAVYDFRTIDKATEFLTDAIRFVMSSRAEQNLKQKTIGTIKRFIDENYDKKLTIKVIARHVYLSPTYLSYLFKAVTDSTLNEYITAVRVEKSKEYLADKQIKLFEVAKRVGYNDPNYFAKVFKKLTGATPSFFREKHVHD